jgi:hypothetical protein
MSRPLRPIDDDLIYHVINRGNNRQKVFGNEGDYLAFLEAIADLKERKPFLLYGYCLMSNPLHLLIRPGEGPITAYEALGAGAAVRRRRWTAYVHQTPDEEELSATGCSNETGLPYKEKLCQGP